MTASETSEVRARLSHVRSRIEDACDKAGRARSEVRLVAVSKKQEVDRVRAAYDAGQRLFGENYVQALEERLKQLPADVDWHMIGHLQRNKAKKIVNAIAMLHTLDSAKLAQALCDARAPELGPLPVLIQVNIDMEPSKAGVEPEQVQGLIEDIRGRPGLVISGLMAIPAPGQGRRWFAALRALRDRTASRSGLPLAELSMGMSSDFEDAIAEGATLVRVGTDIFGERTA